MKTYDPSKVVISFGGITVTGVMSGTFVKCTRNTPTWKLEKGAQGDGVRTRSKDRSGVIEITLQHTSPTNADFSNRALKDEKDASGKGAVSVEDLGGQTLWSGKEAWIEGPPDLERADELTPCVWKLVVDDFEWFTDGSAA